MKFSCEQCKTKYSIPDERVRGKVLKIRCKNCAHVITVREESSASAAPARSGALERALEQALRVPPAAVFQGSDATLVGTPESLLGSRDIAPPPMDADLEEWHLSVDGVATGPFRLDGLAQRLIIERAAGDQEIFVWRDGFDDWQAPGEVPEVRAAVERLRPGLPRNFWSGPSVQKPWGSAGSAAPIEVETGEDYEFSETPPTIAVPRKADKVQPGPARPAAGAPPVPMEALSGKRPRSGQPAHELPIAASGPAPTLAERVDPLAEVLASLRRDSGPAPAAEASAPAAHGNGQEPHPGPGEGGLFGLAISEPSQLIDLSALAGAMRPSGSTPGRSATSLPGVDLMAPPAEPGPPVVVMAGPAPADPGRRLKMGLFALGGLCVLLLGTVGYLALRKPAPHGTEGAADKRDEGRAVKDRPVLVQDDPRLGAAQGTGGDPKKGAARPKAPKLPAAANGKTQISGNAATLAKLYGDGGGTTPTLPAANGTAGASGGGVSGAELQDLMRRNQKSLALCYDRQLKHDETLRGRIDVGVRVGMTGTVTHVSIGAPFSGTELGNCIQQTIRRWHFPPSDNDYETQFPLILTAN